ncbi:uncharacterized protein MONBRDRAFT_35741, partial [Monosiga brevicollis MX1]
MPYVECAWIVGSAIKLLIPAKCAGGVIGRGGENISKLQEETGLHVKLSQTREFYPGTAERTCLIQGEPTRLIVGVNRVLDIIVANDDHQDGTSLANPVTVAVPYNAAGSVLGKGGSILKGIKDATGCKIIISQKDGPAARYGERLIKIVSPTPLEVPREGVKRVMDALLAQEENLQFHNLSISYSTMEPRFGGPPPVQNYGVPAATYEPGRGLPRTAYGGAGRYEPHAPHAALPETNAYYGGAPAPATYGSGGYQPGVGRGGGRDNFSNDNFAPSGRRAHADPNFGGPPATNDPYGGYRDMDRRYDGYAPPSSYSSYDP